MVFSHRQQSIHSSQIIHFTDTGSYACNFECIAMKEIQSLATAFHGSYSLPIQPATDLISTNYIRDTYTLSH